MKLYDFIVGYEHKQREIESVCLLKYELERRGYTVFVYNVHDTRLTARIKLYHAKVLMLPYTYDDSSISDSVQRAITFDKLISLQWEQAIYKHQEDNPDSYRNPSGICKKAVYLSWGTINVNRLTEIAGIDKRLVKLVGNIALDYLKRPLADYYMSREELYCKYNIPRDKKVCLFIASFKSALASEVELQELCKQYGEWRIQQHDIGLKTLYTILEWIQLALELNTELYFVYRPHPGENTDIVDKIQKKYDRFIVNKELSVKQWILAVDKIYTWLSTTVAEVYFAKKNCDILYPYKLPDEAYGRLFDNMNCIVDCNAFLDSLINEQKYFPVDVDILNGYYLVDQDMSYFKIGNVCEEVLNNPYYQIEKREQLEIYRMVIRGKGIIKKITMYLWQYDWVYSFFWWLTKKLHLKGVYFDKKRKEKLSYEKWMRDEFVSAEELNYICKKIKKCVENVDRDI